MAIIEENRNRLGRNSDYASYAYPYYIMFLDKKNHQKAGYYAESQLKKITKKEAAARMI